LDVQANGDNGKGGLATGDVYGTNTDGGPVEFVTTGVFGTTGVDDFNVLWGVNVYTDGTPFNISFRSLSVTAADGSVHGDLMHTVQLVGVTDVSGTIEYNNVQFLDSGGTFASVPAPSTAILIGSVIAGGWVGRRRRKARKG
jgi:hypothetical protein